MKKSILVLLGYFVLSTTSIGASCDGSYKRTCGIAALMVNLSGKGCYKEISIDVVTQTFYRLTCELASYDKTQITYKIFTNTEPALIIAE